MIAATELLRRGIFRGCQANRSILRTLVSVVRDALPIAAPVRPHRLLSRTGYLKIGNEQKLNMRHRKSHSSSSILQVCMRDRNAIPIADADIC